MNEITDDLKRGKASHLRSRGRRLNVVSIKLTYRLNTISIKIPATFFAEIKKLILKFTLKFTFQCIPCTKMNSNLNTIAKTLRLLEKNRNKSL